MARRRPAADPDRVLLVVDGVGRLDGWVRHAAAGIADVELQQRMPAGVLDGRPAVLVTVGGTRLEGLLEVGWRPGHVRFVREGVQRRAYTRAPIALGTLLIPATLDGIWRSRTLDISAGGALVADAASVPLGAHVELVIDLPGDNDDVYAQGQVVRAAGSSIRAVRFETLRPEDRGKVARLVLLHQVAEQDDLL